MVARSATPWPLNVGVSSPGDRGLGLVLPVIKKREVPAALALRIYRSSMSEAEAVRRYMPALRQLVADIVRALD